jgi:hypothetical protein
VAAEALVGRVGIGAVDQRSVGRPVFRWMARYAQLKKVGRTAHIIQAFDARLFRAVAVPGEAQLQDGPRGAGLLRHSKELDFTNHDEW